MTDPKTASMNVKEFILTQPEQQWRVLAVGQRLASHGRLRATRCYAGRAKDGTFFLTTRKQEAGSFNLKDAQAALAHYSDDDMEFLAQVIMAHAFLDDDFKFKIVPVDAKLENNYE
jgi:hypothetical protein